MVFWRECKGNGDEANRHPGWRRESGFETPIISGPIVWSGHGLVASRPSMDRGAGGSFFATVWVGSWPNHCREVMRGKRILVVELPTIANRACPPAMASPGLAWLA